MRQLAVIAAVFAWISPAMAYDNFLPLGMGYSSSNAKLGQLTARDRAIIAQTDVYETDIYMKQLRARQFDARARAFSFDRNSDGILPSVNY